MPMREYSDSSARNTNDDGKRRFRAFCVCVCAWCSVWVWCVVRFRFVLFGDHFRSFSMRQRTKYANPSDYRALAHTLAPRAAVRGPRLWRKTMRATEMETLARQPVELSRILPPCLDGVAENLPVKPSIHWSDAVSLHSRRSHFIQFTGQCFFSIH